MIRVSPQFSIDLQEALDWYALLSLQAENDLKAGVERVLESVAAFPESFPLLTPPRRFALVKRFPWLIVFRIDADVVTILRFLHSASIQEL